MTLNQEGGTSTQAGCYLYHIGPANGHRDLKALGVVGGKVRQVTYGKLSAAISDSPVAKLPILREHLMTHHGVMQEAMEEATILPVRFGTIAEAKEGRNAEERIVEKILKPRHEELSALLEAMQDKVELGLKALWMDMESVFREIAEENPEVRRLRASTMKAASQQAKVTLGRAVQQALLAKKESEKDRILLPLQPLAADLRIGKNFGDRMFLNASFLVNKSGVEEFSKAVASLTQRLQERVRLSSVGPVPISNFVEIVVTWD